MKLLNRFKDVKNIIIYVNKILKNKENTLFFKVYLPLISKEVDKVYIYYDEIDQYFQGLFLLIRSSYDNIVFPDGDLDSISLNYNEVAFILELSNDDNGHYQQLPPENTRLSQKRFSKVLDYLKRFNKVLDYPTLDVITDFENRNVKTNPTSVNNTQQILKEKTSLKKNKTIKLIFIFSNFINLKLLEEIRMNLKMLHQNELVFVYDDGISNIIRLDEYKYTSKVSKENPVNSITKGLQQLLNHVKNHNLLDEITLPIEIFIFVDHVNTMVKDAIISLNPIAEIKLKTMFKVILIYFNDTKINVSFQTESFVANSYTEAMKVITSYGDNK